MVIHNVIDFLRKGSAHFGFFDELILLLLATYQHISRIWGIKEFGSKFIKCFVNFRGKINVVVYHCKVVYEEYLTRVNKYCAWITF